MTRALQDLAFSEYLFHMFLRVCLLEILLHSSRIEKLLHFVIPHLYASHWLVVGQQMFDLRDFISNSPIVSALIYLSSE